MIGATDPMLREVTPSVGNQQFQEPWASDFDCHCDAGDIGYLGLLDLAFTTDSR